MSLPELRPSSATSRVVLPATGSALNVTDSNLPFGVYVDSTYWSASQVSSFQEAASKQVNYTYCELGGNVLDIELSEQQVYCAYEDAVLRYGYLLNIHQSQNSLSDFLGSDATTFTENGQITDETNTVLRNANNTLPRFQLSYARRIAEGIASEAQVGGRETYYSASFDIVVDQQDYDLDAILAADAKFGTAVAGKKVVIRRVYYKTGRASWNFYAFQGGYYADGFMYGNYASDTTFEVMPNWEHKLVAIHYEDIIQTRLSDYSFKMRNNKLRLFPPPTSITPTKFWFEFTIPSGPTDPEIEIADDGTVTTSPYGTSGTKVTNLNNVPFENLPFDSINSIGKDWIKRYALAKTKIMLGIIRSKYTTVPIPGESVTLNGPELINQGKEDQQRLEDQLKEDLEKLTYNKMLEADKEKVQNTEEMLSKVPNPIFFF